MNDLTGQHAEGQEKKDGPWIAVLVFGLACLLVGSSAGCSGAKIRYPKESHPAIVEPPNPLPSPPSPPIGSPKRNK